MALPRVDVRVKDGALGLISPSGANTPVLVGACTSGPLNTLLSFGDLEDLRATLTSGPLAEDAAFVLSYMGGPVYVVRVPSSVVGTAGTVTKTQPAGSSSDGTMTVSGTPLDAYLVRVEILTDGATLAAGTATFRYSLDNGDNYSPTFPLPTAGTFVVTGTGLTLTFADDAGTPPSFKAGDVFTFATTAPYYSSAEALAGIDAALADSSTFFKLHLVGQAASASAAVTLATSVAAKMDAAALAYRYLYATVELPQDTDANLKTAVASFVSTRVELAAGFADYASALGARSIRQSSALASTARAAAVPIAEHLGRIATGNVGGIVRLVRDERAAPGLDEARCTTLRTLLGRPGFFITRGRLASGPTSDFQRVEYRRVMDAGAAKVALDAQVFLNDSVRVSDVGTILEADARSIESYLEGGLRTVLVQPNQASAVSVVVNRTDNLLSTGTLRIKVRIRPLAYAEFVDVEIGFSNPALERVAA